MLELGKRRAAVVLAAIIALQCAVMAYWIGRKTNFHVDDLYSFQYAHCFTGKDEFQYLGKGEEWDNGTRYQASELREQFGVTDETSVFQNLPESLERIATGRGYNGILNAVEYLFGEGEFDPRPALYLNAVLSAITQLLLFLTMRRVGASQTASLLAVLMYGSSGIVISHVVFVRFYILVNMLAMLVLYLHAMMWSCDDVRINLPCELVSLVAVYVALQQSQLVAILCLPLSVGFSVGLLVRKRFAQFLYYALPILTIGILYIALKTDYLDVIFNPEPYANGEISYSHVRSWVSRNLIESTPETFSENLLSYAVMYELHLFGHVGVAIALGCIAAVLVAASVAKRMAAAPDGAEAVAPDGAEAAAPDGDEAAASESDEASAPAGLLARWDAALGRLLREEPGEEPEGEARPGGGFVLVILVMAVFYLACGALVGLWVARYISLTFPLVTMVMWWVLDRLARAAGYTSLAPALLLVVVVVGAFCTALPGRIEYLYLEEEELLTQLEEYDDLDRIIAKGQVSHITYDCVAHSPNDVELYFVPWAHHDFDEASMPDELLVWTGVDVEIELYVEDLLASGYELTYLGSDHAADIYLLARAS